MKSKNSRPKEHKFKSKVTKKSEPYKRKKKI